MSVPEGTRAWRKSWRKRWREGSTYRQLTSLQRDLLRWIEENADDDGRTGPTTERWLAGVLSCPSQKVSRDAVHRAVSALIRAGMVSKQPHLDPHPKPHQEPHLAPPVYVRANWKEYQGEKEEPHLDPHQDPHLGTSDTRTDLAEEGRRKQKKPTPAKAVDRPEHTDWRALIEALNGSWTQRHGAKLVWLGKDWKPLRALLDDLGADEIIRRWLNYLGNEDKFYAGHPLGLFLSQVNRFVVAPAEPTFREPWEGASPTAPGSPEWPEPTPEQLAEWEAQAKSELESRRRSP